MVLCTTAAQPRPTIGVFHNDRAEDHNSPAGDADDWRTGKLATGHFHTCVSAPSVTLLRNTNVCPHNVWT